MKFIIVLFFMLMAPLVADASVNDQGLEVLKKSAEIIDSDSGHEYRLRTSDIVAEVLLLFQDNIADVTYDTVTKTEDVGSDKDFNLLFTSNGATALLIEIETDSDGTGYTARSSTGALLQENGDYILQETEEKIYL